MATDYENLLLAANFILAGATIALAIFTAVLWRATKRLGQIEERRDKDLATSRKLNRVMLKVDLADKINREPIESFMPGVKKEPGAEYYHGAPPEHTTAWFRQLYRLLDYGPDGDGIAEIDLKNIISVWDNLTRGARYDATNVKEALDKLTHIRETLGGNLPRWRTEVLTLTSAAVA